MTAPALGIVADRGQLGTLYSSWRDVQQTRLALAQRGMTSASEALRTVETALARATVRELRAQPVWPWLSQYPGVRGVHVAGLVAIIGDPRRFPGQGCTEGHAFVPDYAPGDPCPYSLGPDKAPCPGTVGSRPGSGVRALWHYLGLHVVDGHSPRKRKGQQANWHMEGRARVLQPGGIAEQIVRLNVEPWVSVYRATKGRLIETRADQSRGIDAVAGSGLDLEGPAIEGKPGLDEVRGLRPFQIDAIARKVAAKAFVGDLLIAMKLAAGEVDFKVVVGRPRGLIGSEIPT